MKKNWDENPQRKKEFSKKFSGKSNPFYGKTHTNEIKEKLRSYRLNTKLSTKTKSNMKEAKAKKRLEMSKDILDFIAISPLKKEILVINFYQFCYENNLRADQFIKVLHKKSKQHKGWKIKVP